MSQAIRNEVFESSFAETCMAQIELARPSGYRVDSGREYQILIDCKKAGSIRSGETKAFLLPPGPHELQLKLDSASSAKIEVDLRENDRAKFACGPRVKQNDEGILVGYVLAFWMIFGFRRYIDLRPAIEWPALTTTEKSWLPKWSGYLLFAVALGSAILFFALTGESMPIEVVVAGGFALVLGGMVGRGTGKLAGRIDKDVQRRRGD